MKKLLCIILAAITLFAFVGCSYAVNGDYNAAQVDSTYFDARNVEKGSGYRVIYDNNTKVMYLVVYGYNAIGITPILNADGTPLLYG